MIGFLQDIWVRLAQELDPGVLAAGIAQFSANLVVAVVTLLLYLALWRLARMVVRPAMMRTGVDRTGQSFVETALRLIIVVLGVVAALGALGINTGSILASLGVAGLTLGFAARDALSNIISGIFIFWDRPFVIDDLIEVGPHYGRVERITLRSTRVVTVDGKMLAIPNTEVVNSTVASYTNFPHLRLDIPVTVGVEEDVERARRVLLGLVEGQDGFLADPPPRVVVTALNDYNVELQLRVWIDNERDHIHERLRLREHMFEALRSAGVDMPFETIRNLMAPAA